MRTKREGEGIVASVNLWSTGDVFSVRIYKYIAGRPDLKWANSYELRAVDEDVAAGSAEVAANVVRSLIDWEQRFHLSDVVFDRGVFSSYVPDGQPYNPASFLTVTDGTSRGAISAGSGGLGLQVCLLVRKDVLFGRTGRNLYRRALREVDVNAVGGDFALEPEAAGNISTLLNSGSPESPSLLANLTAYGLQLVLAKGAPSPDNVRSVLGFTVAGVSVKAYNNRYFDRA